MLWIGVCEAVSVAVIGGIVGACVMAFAQNANNKWSISKLEEYWQEDIYNLKGSATLAHHKIEELSAKISTLSVSKPVNNSYKHGNNKGYNPKRHFDQRG